MSAERWLLDRVAGRIRLGTLRVRFPDGSLRTYGGRLPGPDAEVELRDDGTHRAHYLRRPFHREPDFGVTSVNYDFAELLMRASEPS